MRRSSHLEELCEAYTEHGTVELLNFSASHRPQLKERDQRQRQRVAAQAGLHRVHALLLEERLQAEQAVMSACE